MRIAARSSVVDLRPAVDPESMARAVLDMLHAQDREVAEFVLDASQELALTGRLGGMKNLFGVPVHVVYTFEEDYE